MTDDRSTDDKLTIEVAWVIDRQTDRVVANLVRVNLLIDLAEKWFPEGTHVLAVHRDDLLRAAVVFLHATLEDYLRYVAQLYLPRSSEEVLNRVPLVGSAEALRPEKFFLGRLAAHRGKTVDQVILESVAGYLNRVSFGSTADVVRLLEGIGLSSPSLSEHYPSLASLIERRHQIVHRADLLDGPTGEKRLPAPIEPSTVRQWATVVRQFTSFLTATCIERDFGPRIRASRPSQPQSTGTAPLDRPDKD